MIEDRTVVTIIGTAYFAIPLFIILIGLWIAGLARGEKMGLFGVSLIVLGLWTAWMMTR